MALRELPGGACEMAPAFCAIGHARSGAAPKSLNASTEHLLLVDGDNRLARGRAGFLDVRRPSFGGGECPSRCALLVWRPGRFLVAGLYTSWLGLLAQSDPAGRIAAGEGLQASWVAPMPRSATVIR